MRKSVSETEPLPRKQENPHLYGEYHAWYDVNGDVPGAPPPAWGTLKIDEDIWDLIGLTPARVGNTKRVMT